MVSLGICSWYSIYTTAYTRYDQVTKLPRFGQTRLLFQRWMTNSEGCEGAVCHADNILVYGKDGNEQDSRLHQVPRRLCGEEVWVRQKQTSVSGTQPLIRRVKPHHIGGAHLRCWCQASDGHGKLPGFPLLTGTASDYPSLREYRTELPPSPGGLLSTCRDTGQREFAAASHQSLPLPGCCKSGNWRGNNCSQTLRRVTPLHVHRHLYRDCPFFWKTM